MVPNQSAVTRAAAVGMIVTISFAFCALAFSTAESRTLLDSRLHDEAGLIIQMSAPAGVG